MSRSSSSTVCRSPRVPSSTPSANTSNSNNHNNNSSNSRPSQERPRTAASSRHSAATTTLNSHSINNNNNTPSSHSFNNNNNNNNRSSSSSNRLLLLPSDCHRRRHASALTTPCKTRQWRARRHTPATAIRPRHRQSTHNNNNNNKAATTTIPSYRLPTIRCRWPTCSPRPTTRTRATPFSRLLLRRWRPLKHQCQQSLHRSPPASSPPASSRQLRHRRNPNNVSFQTLCLHQCLLLIHVTSNVVHFRSSSRVVYARKSARCLE